MPQAVPCTHSSVGDLTLSRKLSEVSQQFALLVRGRLLRPERDFFSIRNDLKLYDSLVREHVGRPLQDCRVLEIGFGARPYTLYAMHAFGTDITGVDLDVPMTRLTDAGRIWRHNGLERTLKSALRYLLFDLLENRRLFQFLSDLGNSPFRIPTARLVVNDAAAAYFWKQNSGPYELIYSTDVFEHIPEADLANVIAQMHAALHPGGIAVISPMIFTGILGGHLVELYNYKGGDLPADIPAWDHLRSRTLRANTYLNEMPRRRYRELFLQWFDIISETECEPWLGASNLTPELRRELAQYDDGELFSNRVQFLLRKRLVSGA